MKSNPRELLIDGKQVRKFLFLRLSPIDRREIIVSVEAFTVDHAIARLREKFHWVEKSAWNFIQELDAEHFVGVMGEEMPLVPHGVILAPGSRRVQ
jgi:hypothetical protein